MAAGVVAEEDSCGLCFSAILAAAGAAVVGGAVVAASEAVREALAAAPEASVDSEDLAVAAAVVAAPADPGNPYSKSEWDNGPSATDIGIRRATA